MNSITTHLRPIALVAALVAAAACGPFHRNSGQEQAVLYFSNESPDQADVYAVVRGNPPVRIGTVFGGRTDTLVVPPSIVARAENVNIVARLLARNTTPSSGPVAIGAGDAITVRLPVDEKLLVVLPGE